VREGPEYGVRTMTRLVIDILLFSCMFAFVTGIVIAAANLLIYSGARPRRERALVVLQLAPALMVHHVSLGAVL